MSINTYLLLVVITIFSPVPVRSVRLLSWACFLNLIVFNVTMSNDCFSFHLFTPHQFSSVFRVVNLFYTCFGHVMSQCWRNSGLQEPSGSWLDLKCADIKWGGTNINVLCRLQHFPTTPCSNCYSVECVL